MTSRFVAPLVGAWIEIICKLQPHLISAVAPLVGAWIEILDVLATYKEQIVAPLVGAWIEIVYFLECDVKVYGRSSCRSVD